MLSDWLSRIETRMSRGITFDQIEDEINAAPALDEEQRSALWLYAWSCQTGAHQRYKARMFTNSLDAVAHD